MNRDYFAKAEIQAAQSKSTNKERRSKLDIIESCASAVAQGSSTMDAREAFRIFAKLLRAEKL